MNQYGFLLNKLEKILDKNDIKINEPMSEHIYFKVGGPVDYLLNPKKKEQVVEIINICRNENIPYYIIGNGSNLLVKDGGIRGVVIKLCELDNIEVKDNTIISECGALLSKVSEAALDNSLTGFEFACGIPGSIGGAVYMNAGAYDGEVSHVIKWAEIIDGDGKLVKLSKDELKLGYRTSYIMEHGFVVISACFELKFGDKELIKNRVDELTRRREERQPLEYPSAGSTFKRPPGYFAGKLIQDAGLKGFSLGGAAVSEKHSGFVINKGDATAKDILDLIAHIQATIKEKFGVELNTEVRIIGEEKDN
ncbi:UDP-N-acetylmuramate dehydrogenase [Clostridium intestinale]|jgi:UDP-N-acetylmuramate dehydrogenase|uniref:UDP-N-acetylenolpyruvoylglucosamine reductase n=2 Tax=Clostridium intestinale TaxID=36845 RepID=U2PZB1_9CLOT|nr:UDP-N-acetylmuramate dehydrogenase [Clostridium intestinale]ERK29104.1 UDP-N-acetylenolpyruvoylglucosamine reductase [Clostridium intestinale URNW]QLY80494.1 UDP-N-acetylmuramate dehydrogenase [Clostridium intestinale]